MIITAIILAACAFIGWLLFYFANCRLKSELSATAAHVETRRQEEAKLRLQLTCYQNELADVRAKCVALRERAQITEGWGDIMTRELGAFYTEISKKSVLNRLPIRFVPMLKNAEHHIQQRAKAITSLKGGL